MASPDSATAFLEFSFWLLFAVAIYYLPTLLAYRKKPLLPILLVNLILGWTVIGWIFALIWALVATRHEPALADLGSEIHPVTTGQR